MNQGGDRLEINKILTFTNESLMSGNGRNERTHQIAEQRLLPTIQQVDDMERQTNLGDDLQTAVVRLEGSQIDGNRKRHGHP